MFLIFSVLFLCVYTYKYEFVFCVGLRLHVWMYVWMDVCIPKKKINAAPSLQSPPTGTRRSDCGSASSGLRRPWRLTSGKLPPRHPPVGSPPFCTTSRCHWHYSLCLTSYSVFELMLSFIFCISIVVFGIIGVDIVFWNEAVGSRHTAILPPRFQPLHLDILNPHTGNSVVCSVVHGLLLFLTSFSCVV